MAELFVSDSIGNDANPGTFAFPKKTLDDAIRLNMPLGSVCYLRRGDTFTDQRIRVTLVSPVVPEDRMTFRAYDNGDDPIVSPGRDHAVTVTAEAFEADVAGQTTITASGGGFVAGDVNKFLYFDTDDTCGTIKTFISATQVTINGDFTGLSTPQTAGVYSLSAIDIGSRSFMTFRNVRFTNGIGCPLGSGEAIEFHDNTVDNARAAGGYIIEVGMSDSESFVRDVLVQNCPAAICAVGHPTGGGNVNYRRIRILDCDSDGFNFGGAPNIVIEDCEVGNARLGAIGSVGHQDGAVNDQAGATTSGFIVRNSVFWNVTQGIYQDLNGTSVVTGSRFYGNRFYVTPAYTGGTMASIMVDADYADAELSNLEIHSNFFGDVGGNFAGVTIKAHASGLYSGIRLHNNVAFTDRAGVGSWLSVGAGAAPAIDADYNNANGFQRYTADGNGLHDVLGDPKPVDYIGQAATVFNMRLVSTSPCNGSGNRALGNKFVLPTEFLDADGVLRPKLGPTDLGAYNVATPSTEPKFGANHLCLAGGQHIAIGPTGDFDLAEYDWSFDFWMRPTDAHLIHPFWFFDPDKPAIDNHFALGVIDAQGSKARMRLEYVRDGVELLSVQSSVTPTELVNLEYHHVAIQRASSTLRVFLDGVPGIGAIIVGTVDVDLSGWACEIGRSLIFGGRQVGRFSGCLDQFHVKRGAAPFAGSGFSLATRPYIRRIDRAVVERFGVKEPVSRRLDGRCGLARRSVDRRLDSRHKGFVAVDREIADRSLARVSIDRRLDHAFGAAKRAVDRKLGSKTRGLIAVNRVIVERFAIHTVVVDRRLDGRFVVRQKIDRRLDDRVNLDTAVDRRLDGRFGIVVAAATTYELYHGVGGEPDFDAAPLATSTTLPFDSPVISGAGEHWFVVRERNQHGLSTFNVAITVVDLDGSDNEITPRPREPFYCRVDVLDVPNEKLRVVAWYPYAADGPNAADTWIVYYESIGSDPGWPDNSSPTTIELPIVKVDGVGQLDYELSAPGIGSWGVGVRVKRSSDGRESLNAITKFRLTGILGAGGEGSPDPEFV